MGKMTSPTKPEVHNVPQRRQTKSRATATGNRHKIRWNVAICFMKYANVRERDMHTNTQTYKHAHSIAVHRTLGTWRTKQQPVLLSWPFWKKSRDQDPDLVSQVSRPRPRPWLKERECTRVSRPWSRDNNYRLMCIVQVRLGLVAGITHCNLKCPNICSIMFIILPRDAMPVRYVYAMVRYSSTRLSVCLSMVL